MPIADCQLEVNLIGNWKSEIGNFRHSAILRALESVTDPESPVVSVVEMGMIADVHMKGDCVVIDMTPTFVGCPALDVIRENIRMAVSAVTPAHVAVYVVFDPPWTSDRISASDRTSTIALPARRERSPRR